MCFGFLAYLHSELNSELPLVCGEAQSSNRAIKGQWVTRIKEAPWRKIALTRLASGAEVILICFLVVPTPTWNSVNGI